MITRLPKRRSKRRRTARGTNPAHLQYVRGFECCVGNSDCSGKIEAMHIRKGTDGGMSKKPSDKWAIPGCNFHHAEQHSIGEPRFEKKYGLNLIALAKEFWRQSPHRSKTEDAA